MSGENGEAYGFSPEDEDVVPLSLPGVAVSSPNGNHAHALDQPPTRVRSARLDAGEFTPERMIPGTHDRPATGWRRTVFALSGGVIALSPGPDELRQRELVDLLEIHHGRDRRGDGYDGQDCRRELEFEFLQHSALARDRGRRAHSQDSDRCSYGATKHIGRSHLRY